MFLLSTLSSSHVVVSDHDPIKLELVNTSIPKKQFRFKIDNTWLQEEIFRSDVAKHWKSHPAIHLLPKLLFVSSYMAKWGENLFSHIQG